MRGVTGKVVLIFKVDQQGRPYAIEDVSSTEKSLVSEAKRLLQEGPVWTGSEAKIAVSFK